MHQATQKKFDEQYRLRWFWSRVVVDVRTISHTEMSGYAFDKNIKKAHRIILFCYHTFDLLVPQVQLQKILLCTSPHLIWHHHAAIKIFYFLLKRWRSQVTLQYIGTVRSSSYTFLGIIPVAVHSCMMQDTIAMSWNSWLHSTVQYSTICRDDNLQVIIIKINQLD